MFKKILIVVGIVIIVLVLIGAILVKINSARQKAYYTETTYNSYDRGAIYSPSATEDKVDEISQTNIQESSETSRLMIKTGTIYMVVKNISDSAKSIIQYAQDKGGWIVSSMVSEQKDVPSGSITVRVPAENFDEAMAYFEGLAEKVSYDGIQGQDVTDQYTDLQSNLRNLEAAESQLLKIMEKSGTISEILSVQRELTTVRSQIEQIKGHIQYLEKSAEMATISMNLALSEELLPIPSAEKWRPGYVAKAAWNSLLSCLKNISYILIWAGIFAVIWIPITVIIWLIRKLRRKNKKI
jgi:hypothetical protein